MVDIHNMTFSYGRKVVYDNFNVTFGKGRIYGLLGLNGSGKSTLLYLMSGLLFPKRGSVTFKGKDVTKRNPAVLSDMFIVPEEFELPRMTLAKYVDINSKFYPNFSHEMLKKSLDAFSMSLDMNLQASSMGQRKKAFVCFALATNTSLLLLDEPTNGLDIPSKSCFRKAVAECMTDERTIIISTHQVKDIEYMLDHVLIVDNDVLLNENMENISKKLRFETSSHPTQGGKEFFSMQIGLETHRVVAKEPDQEETPVNLEMLFNATLANRAEVKSVFNN